MFFLYLFVGYFETWLAQSPKPRSDDCEVSEIQVSETSGIAVPSVRAVASETTDPTLLGYTLTDIEIQMRTVISLCTYID